MVDIEKSFQETLVGDVYEILVQEPVEIRQGTKIRDAIEEMLRNPTSHVVYVVDDDMKLVGAVTTAAVLEMIGYKVGVMGASTLSFLRFMRDTLKDDIDSAMRKVSSVKMTIGLKARHSLPSSVKQKERMPHEIHWSGRT